MYLKNRIIYLILFIFSLSLFFPIFSYCFDSDSLYVWSNNSKSIDDANITSTISTDIKEPNSATQNTR